MSGFRVSGFREGGHRGVCRGSMGVVEGCIWKRFGGLVFRVQVGFRFGVLDSGLVVTGLEHRVKML